VADLICPLCRGTIDPEDPGVGEGRDWTRDGESFSYWIPWIADLRGSPTRLVHPACFARNQGIEALVAVVTVWTKQRRGR
jgi:hypothetical protein